MLSLYLEAILDVKDTCPGVLELELRLADDGRFLHAAGGCIPQKTDLSLTIMELAARVSDVCPVCVSKLHFGRTHVKSLSKTASHYSEILLKLESMNVQEENLSDALGTVALAEKSIRSKLVGELHRFRPLLIRVETLLSERKAELIKRVRFECDDSLLIPIAEEVFKGQSFLGRISGHTQPHPFIFEAVTAAVKASVESALRQKSWSLLYAPFNFSTLPHMHHKGSAKDLFTHVDFLVEATKLQNGVYLMPTILALYLMECTRMTTQPTPLEHHLGSAPNWVAAEAAAVLFDCKDRTGAYSTLAKAYEAAKLL